MTAHFQHQQPSGRHYRALPGFKYSKRDRLNRLQTGQRLFLLLEIPECFEKELCVLGLIADTISQQAALDEVLRLDDVPIFDAISVLFFRRRS
jgi:hypothetical protein